MHLLIKLRPKILKTQKTILIVEDERSLREAIADVLRLRNFIVIEAKNGKEGLDMALLNHPDLILLDQIMPEMDGMAALKNIRDDKWGKKVPVILFTNLSGTSEQLVHGVMEHGPVLNLIKSDWKLHDVVKKIEKLLGKQHKHE